MVWGNPLENLCIRLSSALLTPAITFYSHDHWSTGVSCEKDALLQACWYRLNLHKSFFGLLPLSMGNGEKE